MINSDRVVGGMLEISYMREEVILRRKRPDLGPGIEEVRTYPMADAIMALLAVKSAEEKTL